MSKELIEDLNKQIDSFFDNASKEDINNLLEKANRQYYQKLNFDYYKPPKKDLDWFNIKLQMNSK